MFEEGKSEGIETRGISDHGFCRSIYFRDPNGYVIELAARAEEGSDPPSDEDRKEAHAALDTWQSTKPAAP